MIKSFQLNSDMVDFLVDGNTMSWDISRLRFNANSQFSIHSCQIILNRPVSGFLKVGCNLVEKDYRNTDGTIFWETVNKRKYSSQFEVEYKPADVVWWPLDCSNPQKLIITFKNKSVISLDSVCIILKFVESS